MHLEKTVVLAYTDIGAGGSRALLGLNEDDLVFESFSVDGFVDIKPASSLDGSGPTAIGERFNPFQVMSSCQRQVSCVVINALVPGRYSHIVADRIVELIAESSVERLIVLSALHFGASYYGSLNVYENQLSASKLTSHSSLPDSLPLMDSFLSSLIQLLKVEAVPTNLFLVPGYRAREGPVGGETMQVILLFHRILTELFGLKFDSDISGHLMYKGCDDADDDLTSMIYL